MSSPKPLYSVEVLHLTSRLYRSTRRLYLEVELVLKSLGITGVGSPTTQVLVALYVTGLVLLDVRQTQTRVTHFLPGRCHDALRAVQLPADIASARRIYAGNL